MEIRPPLRLADRFPQLQGMRILVVEDNELNQEVVCELLENVGIDVTFANDGVEAIQLVRIHPFDAVLMDVQMPEMDGYAATREIRRAEEQKAEEQKAESRGQKAEEQKSRRAEGGRQNVESPQTPNLQSHIPIIAMTANTTTEDRRSALESGMDDFLTKPIIPHQLFSMLSKWFRRRSNGNNRQRQGIEGVLPECPLSDAQSNVRFPTFLPGLDVETGVARIGGNRPRYIAVLQQFVSRSAAAPDEITELLAHQHILQARQLVHTLKGVAGNLAAYMLHKDLETFEAALRENRRELWDVHLQQIRRSFRQVIEAAAVLSSSEQAPLPVDIPPSLPRKILDSTTILPLLLQVRHLLSENDTASLQCIASLSNKYSEHELAPQLAQLKTSIDQYDFDRAIHVIDRIAEQLRRGEETR